jgi:hypothetical protein
MSPETSCAIDSNESQFDVQLYSNSVGASLRGRPS